MNTNSGNLLENTVEMPKMSTVSSENLANLLSSDKTTELPKIKEDSFELPKKSEDNVSDSIEIPLLDNNIVLPKINDNQNNVELVENIVEEMPKIITIQEENIGFPNELSKVDNSQNNVELQEDIVEEIPKISNIQEENIELSNELPKVDNSQNLEVKEKDGTLNYVTKLKDIKSKYNVVSSKDVVDLKIDKINNNDNVFGMGYVTKVNDYILEANGLEEVTYFEKVVIKGKATGYVTKINPSSVIIALLEEFEKVNVGDVIYQTNEELKGYFSPDSFGHIIDMFGNDKLINKKYEELLELKIEDKNISIMDRSSVNRPLMTGIVGIDLMYPIGRGQRELIVGDRKTGKTQICLDTIYNQKGKNILCIYVAIGKTKKEVKEIYYDLLKKGSMDYTIIITAFNDEKPSILTLTPFFALSVAQFYMFEGKDVLVFIDDLKRHADAYREISLLSGKSPGREAYPADIFYLHSRLLEKGCQHKDGGSITILPVTTTKSGDITDYITTNIISITDGQIVLSAKNFNKGIKPAINYTLSVSRLGGAVQSPNIKKLGNAVRNKLLSYLESREIYELANVDELPQDLRNKLSEGEKLLNNFIQYKYTMITEEDILNNFSSFVENK